MHTHIAAQQLFVKQTVFGMIKFFQRSNFLHHTCCRPTNCRYSLLQLACIY